MVAYCRTDVLSVVFLQMDVPELRLHMESCGNAVGAEFKFRPIQQTSQPAPQ